MKTVIGLFIISAALAGGIYSQQLTPDKVPAKVIDSFHSKFKSVGKVEWKLKSDKNYEAEFRSNGVEIAVKFDETGKWLETETAIKRSELTREVVSAIAVDYKAYKIVETQKVERSNDKQVLFEVHLENPKEILKIQFEGNGTVSSKSAKAKPGR